MASMFVDVAKITVRAGNGGNGAIAFHREKYIAAGGPDGGDGGRGGNVVFKADTNLSTLLDFRYKKHYFAENGDDGRGSNMTGKNAPDLVIRVPRGTLIKDAATGALIKDLSDEEPFVVARGGKGGWGNARFATSTRQCPNFAKNGLKGEELEIQLELKLLADVGLIGFPNVGKSTLLSMVSAARPKIANYHFTTLVPQLGVIAADGDSFVMADIPGLIEGASEGVGLGHEFLRHVDRCRLLVHLVDVSGCEGREPEDDFAIINEELARFNPELATRPQIVVGNKIDIADDPERVERFRRHVEEQGYLFFPLSAATRNGLAPLMNTVHEELSKLPPITVFESDYQPGVAHTGAEDITVTVQDGVYVLEGEWLWRVLGSVNFSDYESLQYMHRVLSDHGIFKRLEEMGIEEGDTVSIYGMEFDYSH